MQVLRAYDTRLRPTPRNPSLYVGADSFRKGSTSVFHFKQTGSELVGLVGFGKTPSLDEYSKRRHLFASQGQLQIIETPFKDGAHVCTSISQAVSLIEELKSLHQKGFCHGDIRAYNCVFSDAGSHLIDFDFGGLAGTVTYPEGYQRLLDDGRRIPDMKDSGAIQKWHDVYALVKLLLEFHICIEDNGGTDLTNLMNVNEGLLFLEGSDGVRDKAALRILDEVTQILKDKTTISPSFDLVFALKSTTSPEKKTLSGFGGSPEHRKKE
jgi:serine/threonine protein kinase